MLVENPSVHKNLHKNRSQVQIMIKEDSLYVREKGQSKEQSLLYTIL